MLHGSGRWAGTRVDQALYLARLHRQVRHCNPVFVYTQGKVGSSTLMATVAASTMRPTMHFHRMTKVALARSARQPRASTSTRRRRGDWRGGYARWLTRRPPPGGRWDVVTGVRDPVALRVSMFFQIGLDRGFFGQAQLDDPELAQSLSDRFLDFWSGIAIRDWFAEEFFPATGVDVYAEPFDPHLGYATYENDRFRVLLIRCEDLSSRAPQAIGEFFNLEEAPKLATRNVAADKRYTALYAAFLAQATIPAELIDEQYASRYTQHFYAPDEIDRFRARWKSLG